VVVAHKRPKAETEEYKYDENKKPPYAYTYIIYHAIKDLNKPQGVTLGEIYIQIMADYAYYRALEKSTAWRNSIRHNLTMHKSFIKVARQQGDSGKGGYWRVDEAIAAEEIAFEPKPVAQPGSKKKKKKKKAAGPASVLPLEVDFAPNSSGIVSPLPSESGGISPQFTYPAGGELGSSPMYAASTELDDVFDDIEQEFNQHASAAGNVGAGAGAAGQSPPASPGMPTIITDEFNEGALLKKMAAQLGNDQPQNKFGASLTASGMPQDLLGVSSVFQASVSGMFSGLSASFNGLQDKFSESFGGVSESFNAIFQWGT
jgi:hypothetical protein